MYPNLIFNFSFSEKDVDRCILKTEEEVRDLIYQVMNQRYGLDWERNVSGFSLSEIAALEKRKEDEKNRFPDQPLSDRLLDYGYITDLKKIICDNNNLWPEFVPIFKA